MDLQIQIAFMKKTLAVALLGLLFGTSAFAQYRLASGTLPSGLELIQADTTDSGTVRMYFEWTAEQDNYGFDIDDDAFVAIPGSFKRYKLVGAGNIPYTSDGSYAVALKAGDSIRFLLDFEAFPLDKPFCFSEESENDSNISCDELTLENGSLPLLDADEFVRSKPSLLKGEFSEEGTTYSFWNYDGLALVANFVKTTDDTHLFYIYLSIANNSGRSVEIDPASIKVEFENKAGRRTPLKVFDAKGYQKRMETENFFNKMLVVANVIGTIESVGNTLTGGQFFNNSPLFDSPVSNYIGLMNSQDNLKKFTKMMNEMQQEYMTATTVENRGWYGGFLCLNEKKNGLYQITVPLMDRNFTFTVLP